MTLKPLPLGQALALMAFSVILSVVWVDYPAIPISFAIIATARAVLAAQGDGS